MPLYRQHLPALSFSEHAPELVLLHGWGMSSRVWSEWLPVLRRHCNITVIDLPGYGGSEAMDGATLDDLLSVYVEGLPTKAVYVGYSLGGMLALQIAHRYPERVSAVVTLASNLCFVANEHWPLAMDPTTFNDFYQTAKQQPAQALKKFTGLQLHGLENNKQLLKTLRLRTTTVTTTETLSGGSLVEPLQLLSTIDNRSALAGLTVPALFLLGSKDVLVPVAVTDKIQSFNKAEVVVIADAPHALFLSHPQPCWQSIERFLRRHRLLTTQQQAQRILDKKQVARSFSRAATSYDSVADLQRRVGEALLTNLPDVDAETVLDLGCGTGYFYPQLQQRFSNSRVIGLDLAEGMVSYASKKQAGHYWLCGDAENIPLADQSLDIIFSSLAIQWCEDNDALFSELFRILKPGAHLIFSTLGPDTLHELRSAWYAVDNYTHVNRFADRAALKAAIVRAGFSAAAYDAAFKQETITLEYDTLKQLTRELKSLGAHNVNSGRPEGLTGKQRLRQFIEAYELQRNARGLLPATYQSWYGVLQKPRQ